MSHSWYKFYPGDYARDTVHLSLLQHGAYRLLLDYIYATENGLPKKPSELYRICNATKHLEKRAVTSVVKEFFIFRAGKWYSKRATREIVARQQYIGSLSDAGRRGAENRWKKQIPHSASDGHPNGKANGVTDSLELAYQNQNQKKKKTLSSKSYLGNSGRGGNCAKPKDGRVQVAEDWVRRKSPASRRADAAAAAAAGDSPERKKFFDELGKMAGKKKMP